MRRIAPQDSLGRDQRGMKWNMILQAFVTGSTGELTTHVAPAIIFSLLRFDIHEGVSVKTRARRTRDFPDIHRLSSRSGGGAARRAQPSRPLSSARLCDAVRPGENQESGPVLRPDGELHHWSLRYDPKAGDGRGEMVAVIDGREQRLPLNEGDRAEGARFDRFGLFNLQSGGWHTEVYVSDLEYTGQ